MTFRRAVLGTIVMAASAQAVQGPLIDINAVPPEKPGNSNPSDFARLGNDLLFAADVPGFGRELCIYDGTEVRMLADLNPGSSGSGPFNLTAAAGRVWFSAVVPGTGRELWVTDGTEAGTQLVLDLVPGQAKSGEPREFTELNGEVIFAANTPTAGFGVWRSDGTAEGTEVLLSNDEGLLPSLAEIPEQLTRVGGQVFFTTFFGRELWRTDGSVSGTGMLTQAFTYSGIDDLVEKDGFLFFLASTFPNFDRRVYRTMGGPIEEVADPNLPFEMARFGDDLVVVGRDANSDWSLFRSDGTPGSLELLITPYTGFTAVISQLTAADTFLAFTVDGAPIGKELWATDGTPAGTGLIADAVPGADGLEPEELVAFGDRVAFSGLVGDEREPWVTDGVSVAQLVDISASGGSDPANLYADGSTLWFAATDDGVGREIWSTDGTGIGTALLEDFGPTPTSAASNPANFTRVGALTVFTADDGVHGIEPWVTDGTAEGTLLLADILPGPASSQPLQQVVLGDRVYFIALEDDTTSPPRFEVWRTDGTPEGTERFTRLYENGLFYPQNLAATDSLLFFEATDFAVFGWEPFASDGTVEGTTRLGNLNPNSISKDSDPTGYIDVGDFVMFTARDSALLTRIWRTEGTPETTRIIDEANDEFVQGAFGTTVLPGGLAVFSGFFTGQESKGSEPWVTDGTAAGTQLLADIYPGSFSSQIQGLRRFGDSAVFTAENADLGRELWITDGTPAGTRVFYETLPGPEDEDPAILGVVGDRLLFRADDTLTADLWATVDGVVVEKVIDLPDQAFGAGVTSAPVETPEALYVAVSLASLDQQTWVTDGTLAGSFRLDLPQENFSLSQAIAVGQGPEVVTRSSGPDGTEVWTTRGKPLDVRQLLDVAPGPTSSFPQQFLRVGDSLLFTADEYDTGRELYTLPFVDTDGHVLEPYGSGCAGTGGLAPELSAVGAARLGETPLLELDSALGGSPAFLFLSFDTAPTPLGDCTQYPTDPLFAFATTVTSPGGEATVPIPLPAELTGLIGAPVYFQFAVIDPGGGFLDAVALSNGLEAIVGPGL